MRFCCRAFITFCHFDPIEYGSGFPERKRVIMVDIKFFRCDKCGNIVTKLRRLRRSAQLLRLHDRASSPIPSMPQPKARSGHRRRGQRRHRHGRRGRPSPWKRTTTSSSSCCTTAVPDVRLQPGDKPLSFDLCPGRRRRAGRGIRVPEQARFVERQGVALFAHINRRGGKRLSYYE